MTIYFQPTGSKDAPQPFDYGRLIRADLGPEIITRKSPSRGTFWMLYDAGARPADSPLYTIGERIEFTDEAFTGYPHFKRAVRTWMRTRKPQAEIDALIEARREAVEEERTRRALELVLRYLNRLSAVPAVQNAVPQALRDRVAAAVQRLQENDAEAAALKAQAATGADVEVAP